LTLKRFRDYFPLELMPKPKAKDPAAVALGRKGGLIGGKVKSAAKTKAILENLKKATARRWPKNTKKQG
jgi:hypothetical protein